MTLKNVLKNTKNHHEIDVLYKLHADMEFLKQILHEKKGIFKRYWFVEFCAWLRCLFSDIFSLCQLVEQETKKKINSRYSLIFVFLKEITAIWLAFDNAIRLIYLYRKIYRMQIITLIKEINRLLIIIKKIEAILLIQVCISPIFLDLCRKIKKGNFVSKSEIILRRMRSLITAVYYQNILFFNKNDNYIFLLQLVNFENSTNGDDNSVITGKSVKMYKIFVENKLPLLFTKINQFIKKGMNSLSFIILGGTQNTSLQKNTKENSSLLIKNTKSIRKIFHCGELLFKNEMKKEIDNSPFRKFKFSSNTQSTFLAKISFFFGTKDDLILKINEIYQLFHIQISKFGNNINHSVKKKYFCTWLMNFSSLVKHLVNFNEYIFFQSHSTSIFSHFNNDYCLMRLHRAQIKLYNVAYINLKHVNPKSIIGIFKNSYINNIYRGQKVIFMENKINSCKSKVLNGNFMLNNELIWKETKLLSTELMKIYNIYHEISYDPPNIVDNLKEDILPCHGMIKKFLSLYVMSNRGFINWLLDGKKDLNVEHRSIDDEDFSAEITFVSNISRILNKCSDIFGIYDFINSYRVKWLDARFMNNAIDKLFSKIPYSTYGLDDFETLELLVFYYVISGKFIILPGAANTLSVNTDYVDENKSEVHLDGNICITVYDAHEYQLLNLIKFLLSGRKNQEFAHLYKITKKLYEPLIMVAKKNYFKLNFKVNIKIYLELTDEFKATCSPNKIRTRKKKEVFWKRSLLKNTLRLKMGIVHRCLLLTSRYAYCNFISIKEKKNSDKSLSHLKSWILPTMASEIWDCDFFSVEELKRLVFQSPSMPTDRTRKIRELPLKFYKSQERSPKHLHSDPDSEVLKLRGIKFVVIGRSYYGCKLLSKYISNIMGSVLIDPIDIMRKSAITRKTICVPDVDYHSPTYSEFSALFENSKLERDLMMILIGMYSLEEARRKGCILILERGYGNLIKVTKDAISKIFGTSTKWDKIVGDYIISEECIEKGYVLVGCAMHFNNIIDHRKYWNFIFGTKNCPEVLINAGCSEDEITTFNENVRINPFFDEFYVFGCSEIAETNYRIYKRFCNKYSQEYKEIYKFEVPDRESEIIQSFAAEYFELRKQTIPPNCIGSDKFKNVEKQHLAQLVELWRSVELEIGNSYTTNWKKSTYNQFIEYFGGADLAILLRRQPDILAKSMRLNICIDCIQKNARDVTIQKCSIRPFPYTHTDRNFRRFLHLEAYVVLPSAVISSACTNLSDFRDTSYILDASYNVISYLYFIKLQINDPMVYQGKVFQKWLDMTPLLKKPRPVSGMRARISIIKELQRRGRSFQDLADYIVRDKMLNSFLKNSLYLCSPNKNLNKALITNQNNQTSEEYLLNQQQEFKYLDSKYDLQNNFEKTDTSPLSKKEEMLLTKYQCVFSSWKYRDPVAHYEGKCRRGKYELAVRLCNKVYFFCSEQTMRAFKMNPGVYLIPMMPLPSCQAIVIRQNDSIQLPIAKVLSAYFGAQIILFKKVLAKGIIAYKKACIERLKNIYQPLFQHMVNQTSFPGIGGMSSFPKIKAWIRKSFELVFYRAYIRKPKFWKKSFSGKILLFDISQNYETNLLNIRKGFPISNFLITIGINDATKDSFIRLVVNQWIRMNSGKKPYFLNSRIIQLASQEKEIAIEKILRSEFRKNFIYDLFGSYENCRLYADNPFRLLERIPRKYTCTVAQPCRNRDTKIISRVIDIGVNLIVSDIKLSPRKKVDIIAAQIIKLENIARKQSKPSYGGWIIDGFPDDLELLKALDIAGITPANIIYMHELESKYRSGYEMYNTENKKYYFFKNISGLSFTTAGFKKIHYYHAKFCKRKKINRRGFFNNVLSRQCLLLPKKDRLSFCVIVAVILKMVILHNTKITSLFKENIEYISFKNVIKYLESFINPTFETEGIRNDLLFNMKDANEGEYLYFPLMYHYTKIVKKQNNMFLKTTCSILYKFQLLRLFRLLQLRVHYFSRINPILFLSAYLGRLIYGMVKKNIGIITFPILKRTATVWSNTMLLSVYLHLSLLQTLYFNSISYEGWYGFTFFLFNPKIKHGHKLKINDQMMYFLVGSSFIYNVINGIKKAFSVYKLVNTTSCTQIISNSLIQSTYHTNDQNTIKIDTYKNQNFDKENKSVLNCKSVLPNAMCLAGDVYFIFSLQAENQSMDSMMYYHHKNQHMLLYNDYFVLTNIRKNIIIAIKSLACTLNELKVDISIKEKKLYFKVNIMNKKREICMEKVQSRALFRIKSDSSKGLEKYNKVKQWELISKTILACAKKHSRECPVKLPHFNNTEIAHVFKDLFGHFDDESLLVCLRNCSVVNLKTLNILIAPLNSIVTDNKLAQYERKEKIISFLGTNANVNLMKYKVDIAHDAVAIKMNQCNYPIVKTLICTSLVPNSLFYLIENCNDFWDDHHHDNKRPGLKKVGNILTISKNMALRVMYVSHTSSFFLKTDKRSESIKVYRNKNHLSSAENKRKAELLFYHNSGVKINIILNNLLLTSGLKCFNNKHAFGDHFGAIKKKTFFTMENVNGYEFRKSKNLPSNLFKIENDTVHPDHINNAVKFIPLNWINFLNIKEILSHNNNQVFNGQSYLFWNNKKKKHISNIFNGKKNYILNSWPFTRWPFRNINKMYPLYKDVCKIKKIWLHIIFTFNKIVEFLDVYSHKWKLKRNTKPSLSTNKLKNMKFKNPEKVSFVKNKKYFKMSNDHNLSSDELLFHFGTHHFNMRAVSGVIKNFLYRKTKNRLSNRKSTFLNTSKNIILNDHKDILFKTIRFLLQARFYLIDQAMMSQVIIMSVDNTKQVNLIIEALTCLNQISKIFPLNISLNQFNTVKEIKNDLKSHNKLPSNMGNNQNAHQNKNIHLRGVNNLQKIVVDVEKGMSDFLFFCDVSGGIGNKFSILFSYLLGIESSSTERIKMLTLEMYLINKYLFKFALNQKYNESPFIEALKIRYFFLGKEHGIFNSVVDCNAIKFLSCWKKCQPIFMSNYGFSNKLLQETAKHCLLRSCLQELKVDLRDSVNENVEIQESWSKIWQSRFVKLYSYLHYMFQLVLNLQEVKTMHLSGINRIGLLLQLQLMVVYNHSKLTYYNAPKINTINVLFVNELKNIIVLKHSYRNFVEYPIISYDNIKTNMKFTQEPLRKQNVPRFFAVDTLLTSSSSSSQSKLIINKSEKTKIQYSVAYIPGVKQHNQSTYFKKLIKELKTKNISNGLQASVDSIITEKLYNCLEEKELLNSNIALNEYLLWYINLMDDLLSFDTWEKSVSTYSSNEVINFYTAIIASIAYKQALKYNPEPYTFLRNLEEYTDCMEFHSFLKQWIGNNTDSIMIMKNTFFNGLGFFQDDSAKTKCSDLLLCAKGSSFVDQKDALWLAETGYYFMSSFGKKIFLAACEKNNQILGMFSQSIDITYPIVVDRHLYCLDSYQNAKYIVDQPTSICNLQQYSYRSPMQIVMFAPETFKSLKYAQNLSNEYGVEIIYVPELIEKFLLTKYWTRTGQRLCSTMSYIEYFEFPNVIPASLVWKIVDSGLTTQKACTNGFIILGLVPNSDLFFQWEINNFRPDIIFFFPIFDPFLFVEEYETAFYKNVYINQRKKNERTNSHINIYLSCGTHFWQRQVGIYFVKKIKSYIDYIKQYYGNVHVFCYERMEFLSYATMIHLVRAIHSSAPQKPNSTDSIKEKTYRETFSVNCLMSWDEILNNSFNEKNILCPGCISKHNIQEEISVKHNYIYFEGFTYNLCEEHIQMLMYIPLELIKSSLKTLRKKKLKTVFIRDKTKAFESIRRFFKEYNNYFDFISYNITKHKFYKRSVKFNTELTHINLKMVKSMTELFLLVTPVITGWSNREALLLIYSIFFKMLMVNYKKKQMYRLILLKLLRYSEMQNAFYRKIRYFIFSKDLVDIISYISVINSVNK